jgi:PKHD-type hydroxylase
MQYLVTPYAEEMEPFVWWDNGFTSDELDWLQTRAANAENQAQVQGNPEASQLEHIRRSRVSWLEHNAESDWFFKKLAHIAASLNSQYYRFDVTGFAEPLQLTNYDCSDKGTYVWHRDGGGKRTVCRKLSLVLQLSEPEQYEGGELQLMTSAIPITVQKKRGLLAAFPSYTLHQVSPVTSGNRQSLVAWASGPAFK